MNKSMPNELIGKSEDFWSSHNVTNHVRFYTADESLAYFHWRNDQYVGYIDLMPVSGHDGETILDFGCGPGNDLVGLCVYSNPPRLIGMDVSQPSLDEARDRLRLHNATVELVKISENDRRLPLENQSIDYLHCSGVLMNVVDPLDVLKEFYRILKPGRSARIMVYNYDSIWVNLYVAFMLMNDPSFAGLSLLEIFYRSTDGGACPINRCWKPQEFLSLAQSARFQSRHLGNAISLFEMSLLGERFKAMQALSFPPEHRRFLASLTFDKRGLPLANGVVAGIDACFELRKPASTAAGR